MTTSDSDDPTRGPFSSPCFNLLWRHYHQEMKDDEERQARITSFLALVTQYLKLKEEEDGISVSHLKIFHLFYWRKFSQNLCVWRENFQFSLLQEIEIASYLQSI